jgi:hypothetical protein
MASKRKLRYQSKGNQYPTLQLTGRSFLLHFQEAEAANLLKGDALFYLHGDSAGRERDNPLYEEVGGAGYLKAMVYDGKEWQFLLMDDIFAGREHHYAKKERPLDRFFLCEEVIAKNAGLQLQRKYRQHYEPLPADEDA